MAARQRLVALDHLRGFVVALVVLHHAVLAYTRFAHLDHRHYLLSSAPVVDPRRWVGFDVLVLLNDSYFMALMFLLSGLFVRGGLARLGPRGFLLGRTLRLGAPFAVSVVVLSPLAYYPSWLETGGAPGFLRFWSGMVTTGPWPSGPAWFVGVLLVFDAAAALVFGVAGQPRMTLRVPAGSLPMRGFLVFLTGLIAAYLPFLALFGPGPWISIGPLAIQASRIGLYAISFAFGVALGPDPIGAEAAPLRTALVGGWGGWSLLTLVSAVLLIGVSMAQLRHGSALTSGVWQALHGLALAGLCATACVAAVAVFLRFAGQPGRVWGSLAANSYAIYLLHYPVVTWTQFALLPVPAGPIAKAAAVFALVLGVSWMAAAMLRRMPGVRRVL
jgi:peptidoglycan/LPS O-acetylase OafA/YrhL